MIKENVWVNTPSGQGYYATVNIGSDGTAKDVKTGQTVIVK
jgi:hypothetical protein